MKAAPPGPVAKADASTPISARAAAALQRRLLDWYAREARDLPWRQTRDPYAIWVSEIMLQQTQVATVTPYYRQFLERFPSVRHLAEASIDEVLAAWSGLGYYRRARSLHAAAQEMVRDHGARVPSDAESFHKLPGVGRYTAGAVLSIAFGHPLPVLDGNVARVISRIFGIAESVRDAQGSRRLWEIAESLVPMQTPGDWNQALMEMGATICLPKSPRCKDCPVARSCVARIENRIDQLPPTGARRETVAVRRAIALVEWQGQWVVEQLSGELLDGLWEPPGVELREGENAGPALREKLRALGIFARITDSGARVRHAITHRRIEVEVWKGRVQSAPPRRAALSAVNFDSRDVALTALARRAMEM